MMMSTKKTDFTITAKLLTKLITGAQQQHHTIDAISIRRQNCEVARLMFNFFRCLHFFCYCFSVEKESKCALSGFVCFFSIFAISSVINMLAATVPLMSAISTKRQQCKLFLLFFLVFA